jgi:hypothetical protein
MINKYDREAIEAIRHLVGTTITYMYYQRMPILCDMFLTIFKSETEEFALHCCCYLRVIRNEKLILSTYDVYLDKETRLYMSTRKYRSQERYEKSYLDTAIPLFMKGVEGYKVTDILCMPFGDLYIYFENGDRIELIVDTHEEDYELYRFFKCAGIGEKHYVASMRNCLFYFIPPLNTHTRLLTDYEKETIGAYLALPIPQDVLDNHILAYDRRLKMPTLNLFGSMTLKHQSRVFDLDKRMISREAALKIDRYLRRISKTGGNELTIAYLLAYKETLAIVIDFYNFGKEVQLESE